MQFLLLFSLWKKTGNWWCGELGPQYWDGHEDYCHSSGVCAQGSTSIFFHMNSIMDRGFLVKTLEWWGNSRSSAKKTTGLTLICWCYAVWTNTDSPSAPLLQGSILSFTWYAFIFYIEFQESGKLYYIVYTLRWNMHDSWPAWNALKIHVIVVCGPSHSRYFLIVWRRRYFNY